MTIRLASCKTAKGENSIADRLAAEMAKDGSKVYAPTEKPACLGEREHCIHSE